jgi:tetratricopeptide (TPR) repeat protein
VYGMVDLFQSWQAYREYDRLIVVCDNYDRVSSLVRGFFTELLRRVGKRVNLTLVLAANPGNGNKVLEEFDSYTDKQFIKLDLPTTEIFPSAAEMSRLAEDLATQIGNDKIEREIHLPQLIQYWQNSDRPELAVDAQIKALRVYLKQCYYEDALYYGESALAGLQQYYPADLDRYWDVCEKLHDCYICLNRSDDALNIIQKAIATTTNPERLFKGFNRMATIDARYLRDRRNLAKSEEYINLGFQQLENIDRPPVEKFYYKALLMRGLALIRHLQGRFDEALEICRSTYDETIRIAGSNRYLAHQTLLQFNISRVYISTKQPEAALVAISQAIEIDPEYSEYYNHRGNIYAGIKHFDEAVADYIKAIETSPPYPEVWTNLAQCYRQMDELDRAIAAYTRSLELSPAVSLALIGRAQCYELLGEISLAIADYSHALELDSNQPLVLANRATLYYEIADYNSSLEDLNTALKLAPDNAEFHQNRAIAFLSLGRTTEAILDLQTYLNMNPEAADKMEVETQLSELKNHASN